MLAENKDMESTQSTAWHIVSAILLAFFMIITPALEKVWKMSTQTNHESVNWQNLSQNNVAVYNEVL